ncbi:unnamed protein product [Prunus armeniaca]|uniref:Uncharacterized protein n=1 Tax=Prunus armeniaca TaxID=36596 RepID=A0A6J5Y8A4_PRUAR|nr:unnamed protein product [Prunus armeniaca]
MHGFWFSSDAGCLDKFLGWATWKMLDLLGLCPGPCRSARYSCNPGPRVLEGR